MRKRIATFDDLRDAIAAYRLPRILIAALELNLFTAIGTDSWTIPDLARDVKVSERGLAILCRNLAMAGVLKKKGETYTNSRLGATALNAQHPAYRMSSAGARNSRLSRNSSASMSASRSNRPPEILRRE